MDLSSRRFLADVAVNIAIYVPLGMSGYLAFRRYKSKLVAIASPILIGAAVSACVEMGQLFTLHRQTSAVDLANNVLGTVLGVLAGMVFVNIVDLPEDGFQFVARDRVAVMLLFCWVAYLLFPLFPVTMLAVWKHRILGLVYGKWFVPLPILLSATEWFAVGRLLVATGAGAPLGWLFALLLLVPTQIAIVDHDLIPADFLGPAIGLLLFALFRRGVKADGIAGILLLIAVTVRGLAPFHFGGSRQPFLWIPFIGLLATSWQAAISVLLGKLFQYGAAIWLLSSSLRMVGAAVLVTALLGLIEVLQMQMPVHVAEITDPLLAILLSLVFVVLRRQPERPTRDEAKPQVREPVQ